LIGSLLNIYSQLNYKLIQVFKNKVNRIKLQLLDEGTPDSWY